MKHKGTIQLQTDRLILRRFNINDAQAAFANWASDSDVTTYLRWPHHESVGDTEDILKYWINKYGEDDFYQWAIILKDNGDEPIGTISVVDKNDAAEMVHVGYCIGKKWWHQGITSEAFDTIIPFFFKQVQINRIESMHDPRNPNSGKVMLKCGLKYEGTMREADWNNQGICDASMYAILAKDFLGKN